MVVLGGGAVSYEQSAPVESMSPHGSSPHPKPFQGYPTYKKTHPPKDPTVEPCLGLYGDPRVVGVSDERGTPVAEALNPIP
jgi:hypothetical protein